jgi:hypothetical protein
MKRLVTATLAAVALAACFDDPTSDLRDGAARLVLSRTSLVISTGDSIQVQVTALDAQGNQVPVGDVSWVSADPNIAAISGETEFPGNVYERAFVRGVTFAPGTTTITVTAQGVSDSVRVTVLPSALSGNGGTAAVSGTAAADTIAGAAPFVYTAGDTIVLTASGALTFDNDATVSLGSTSGYIVSQSATQIKVMSRGPFAGRPVVRGLTYTGPGQVGTLTIDSLFADSVLVSRARFTGTATVSNDPNFGTNTLLTLTAAPGSAFRTTAPLSTVRLGSASAIVLTRSATTITAITGTAAAGQPVMVTNVDIGTGTVDSLRAGTAAAGSAVTIAASNFPGTATSGGDLLDTVTIAIAGAGNAFCASAAAPCGTARSTVTINGVAAYLISRTTTAITAVAALPGTGSVTITNVNVNGTLVPSLSTSATLNVTTTTGEPNEPGNDAPGGATARGMPAAVGDTVWTFGAINTGDIDDFFAITPGTSGNYTFLVEWAGTGLAPDIDMFVLNSAGTLTACADDSLGCAAATGALPQSGTAALTGGTSYRLYINLYDGGGASMPRTYRVRVIRTS